MIRFGKRRAILESISEKLRQGAAGLRSSADRDNAFYQAVVGLQRFWKARLSMRLGYLCVLLAAFCCSIIIQNRK